MQDVVNYQPFAKRDARKFIVIEATPKQGPSKLLIRMDKALTHKAVFMTFLKTDCDASDAVMAKVHGMPAKQLRSNIVVGEAQYKVCGSGMVKRIINRNRRKHFLQRKLNEADMLLARQKGKFGAPDWQKIKAPLSAYCRRKGYELKIEP